MDIIKLTRYETLRGQRVGRDHTLFDFFTSHYFILSDLVERLHSHLPPVWDLCLPWHRHSGGEGESTVGYTFTHSRLHIYPLCGIFACSGIDTPV
jgi:hypothetical protein